MDKYQHIIKSSTHDSLQTLLLKEARASALRGRTQNAATERIDSANFASKIALCRGPQ